MAGKWRFLTKICVASRETWLCHTNLSPEQTRKQDTTRSFRPARRVPRILAGKLSNTRVLSQILDTTNLRIVAKHGESLAAGDNLLSHTGFADSLGIGRINKRQPDFETCKGRKMKVSGGGLCGWPRSLALPHNSPFPGTNSPTPPRESPGTPLSKTRRNPSVPQGAPRESRLFRFLQFIQPHCVYNLYITKRQRRLTSEKLVQAFFIWKGMTRDGKKNQ